MNKRMKCPNCGAYKVHSVTAVALIMAFIALPIGVVLLVIPPVGILFLLGAIIAIPALAVAAAAGHGKVYCQQCNWRGTKAEAV